MIDKALFKYYVIRAGKTMESLASYLGINPSTLHRKLIGESDFYRSEIRLIANYLNLTPKEVNAIFFLKKNLRKRKLREE